MGFHNSIFFTILVIIINQFGVLHLPAAAKDVLSPGDELNSTSTLVSAGGSFTLGFFTIPSTSFTYLGIWYTKDDQKRKVWIANRDTPMNHTGVLAIDSSGTLKVISGGITLFNITDQVGSGNTSAVLQDSGNFVLHDVTDNRLLWQSFDDTTNFLLLGMKLGYNLTTGQNWTLTSWLSEEVPALGAFALRLEQLNDSYQLVMRRRGEVYWTSGPWRNISSQFSNNFYDGFFSLLSDSGGCYVTFQPYGLGLSLSPEGQIMDASTSRFLTPEFCYGYQTSDGCAVSTLPSCRGQNNSFVLYRGHWVGGSSHYDDNSSISLSDCMERCWKDCTCTGFDTNNGTGCITWVGDMTFWPDETVEKVGRYVLAPREPYKSRQKPSEKKTLTWITAVIATVLTSMLAASIFYVRIRRRRLEEREQRRRDKYIHQLAGSNSFNYANELEKCGKDAPGVKFFNLGAILVATDNFSNENKLGQGGYGPVYKGKLLDERKIAVKRLSKTSGQGIEQFKSELILISKLQHTNLVRLLGCCIHEEENILIYEYMPNKSLDFFLFAEDKKERLDWQKRFNIIEGVAQGLLYLHKYSRMRVIHRDLKASNVLLDENMNPKIADFGMAKIFKQNETEAMTLRVVGTYGYMAPEYAMEGTFSIKSDVFSFGVLILEIVSGRRNSSFYEPDRPLNLVGYAWELWKDGAALELKDPTLNESCDVKQLLRSIHVGLLCVQKNAEDRPTISHVISMLNNEIADLPGPRQPAFFTGRRPLEVSPSQQNSRDDLLDKKISYSVNNPSLTTMEAR